MLREREKVIGRAIMLLDMVMLSAAFFVSYFLRAYFHIFYRFNLIPSEKVIGAPVALLEYLPVLSLWTFIWVFMLFLHGAYRSIRTRPFLEIIWIIIKAAFFSVLAFGTFIFLLKMQFVSRLFVIIFIVISFCFLLLEKWMLLSIIHKVARSGYNLCRLLIVGTGRRAGRFIEMVKEHPEWGFEIAGLVDDEALKVGKEFFGIKTIGILANIPEILRTKIIDEVVFIVPRMWLERVQESITACEIQGVRTHVAADLFNLNIARARMDMLEDFPLLTFETTFGKEWELFIKRAADVAVSAAGLLILLPFFLIVAALIKLTSPGPVFFKQKREGVNGRIFTLYKFRSMYKDAQKRLAEVKHLNEMEGPVFKIKDDPRVTPLGCFLRKMSIDELPQLFNVFRGQMSLVGPRPPLPGEVKEYELWQRRRLSMRPGITCLWQVSGRNDIDFDTWMELDLEYIDNWSLWLDFQVLTRTIPVVLFGVGAR